MGGREPHRRYISLPGPRGGPERAFRIPISAPMRRCLERAKQAGKLVAEPQAKTWVFPAETSESGHIEEPKGDVEGRSPHALRHTFRGMCAGAKVTKLHSRLLMNHKISNDIHDEYMTVPAMFDQFREASEAAAAYITGHLPRGAWRALDRRLREDLKDPN